MNECARTELRDMFPELLHERLSEADKLRLEGHVATCASCAEELRVLRTVKSASAFEPPIDVNRIVAQIPPYVPIQPRQAPSRSRTTSWLVAATFAVVAVVAGSLYSTRSVVPSTESTVQSTTSGRTQVAETRVPPVTSAAAAPAPVHVHAIPTSHTHALAVAADVDGLSNGSLVRLMDDMDHMDGLPASDPEPVFAMDTGDEIGQR